MFSLPLDVSQILHENADHLGVLEDAPTQQEFFSQFLLMKSLQMKFFNGILVEVSGHILESSQI
jgi:hypothetical protein